MQNITSLVRVLVVTGLVALTACDTAGQKEKPAAQTSNPGALPAGQPDVTPQLNASTYLAHGDLLERQGHFAQAVVQYRKALELAPDMGTARNRLGITLNKLGQHEEASREFRVALQRTPDSANLYNNLGFSLHLEGKHAEAERALREALRLQPEFRRAHMNLGTTLAKLGRFDEALAEFLLAVPEADAHYNLAVMQVEAQRYAEAARSLEFALKFNPEFTAARQQLREVARLAAAQEIPPPKPAAVAAGGAAPELIAPPAPADPQWTAAAVPADPTSGPGGAAPADRKPMPYARSKHNAAVANSLVHAHAQARGAVLASDVQASPPRSSMLLPGDRERVRSALYSLLVQRGMLPEDYADSPIIAGPALCALLDSLLATSPWTDGTLVHLSELVQPSNSEVDANGVVRGGR